MKKTGQASKKIKRLLQAYAGQHEDQDLKKKKTLVKKS